MKRAQLTTFINLSIVGLVVILTTACGNTQPMAAKPAQAVMPNDTGLANETVVEPAQEPPVATVHVSNVTAVSEAAMVFTEEDVTVIEASIEEDVVDAPQQQVPWVWATLNADTQAANLRRGPGLDYEILGTVDQTSRIMARCKAEDSLWLLVSAGGQTGWLAGDLVEEQDLLDTLPQLTAKPLAQAQDAETTSTLDIDQAQTGDPNIYTGVGVQVQYNANVIEIVAPYQDSPAYNAGIRAGDIVTAIDGEAVQDPANSRRMLGEKGTEVILTVFRPATGETLELPIVRDEIKKDGGLVCTTEPIRGFGTVWQDHPEIHHKLGCPFANWRRDEHATPAAVQTFEHGWMLWLETDTVANVDPIYVFFEDDSSYIRYGDRPLIDAHSYAHNPEGFYKVGDRFAKVYWEEIGQQGRERLGYATNEARDSLGAFQEFENGRMFWAYESDTIYVIYHSQQTWTSFEDKFEAPEKE